MRVPFRLLSALLAATAISCASARPDLVVDSIAVDAVRPYEGSGSWIVPLEIVVANAGDGALSSHERFEISAYLRNPESPGERVLVAPLRFDWPGGARAFGVKLWIPAGGRAVLRRTAYATTDWSGGLEVVVVVDSCRSGPPCSVEESDERNNVASTVVLWPGIY